MKFVHFGCWNSIDCKYNYRDVIIEYIKAYDNDCSMLIISGDNWYPNKLKDYKMYFVNVLQSGLLNIYDLGKECHIVLGNHDEDNDDQNNDIPEKQNCMSKTEAYYVKAINANKSKIPVPTLDDLQVHEKQLKRSLSTKSVKSSSFSPNKPMMIMHESKNAIDFRLTNDGNLFVFINTNIFYTDDKGSIIGYIDMVVNTLKSQHQFAKNIFIVGHLPITSMKMKNEKLKITKIHEDIKIIDYFIAAIDPYRPIYLCADTHNFQITKISNIVQVVVGTGGADPDILSFATNELKYDLSNKYKISGYYHNAFGYSVIDVNNETNEITITYKHILSDIYIHKQYDYKLGAVMLHDVKDIKIDQRLVEKIQNVEQLQKDMEFLCANMTDENVVKNKNIYCYKKEKK